MKFIKKLLILPVVKLIFTTVFCLSLVVWFYSGIMPVWQNPRIPPEVESTSAAGWYNADWGYRQKITIDYTKVSTTLSNFPVLINTSSDSGLVSYAQADGDDILFTSDDGTTKLNHEIESYTSSTGALVAWVQVPSLSDSADTVLYMYYGNSGASNQQNATSTWDSNFVGVYHLKEDPTGTAPQMKDSSQAINHGTAEGGVFVSGDQKTAIVNGGLGLATTAKNHVAINVTTSLNITGAITVSAWIKRSGALNSSFVSKNYVPGSTQRGWELTFAGTVAGFRIFYNGGLSRLITNETGTSAYNTWGYYSGVFEPSVSVRLYKNGAFESSVSAATVSAQSNDATIPVYIGDRPIGADCSNCYVIGTMDEVRISNVVRSSGWILTEYNNMNSPSTFYTINGTAETPPFYDQIFYKFFANANSTDVGSQLADQNTSTTLSAAGGAFRLRLGLHLTGSDIDASAQNFKLQFAEKSGDCDGAFSGEVYGDVTTTSTIAYYDNASPSDGDTLTANGSDPNIGNNVIEQTYEELNNFTNSVGAIAVGEEGLWDFSLYDNGSPTSTSYCFRVVKSDSSQLDSYTEIPEIITSSGASPVVSIAVSDGIIIYGYLPAGSSTDTIGIGDSQTVSNDGNVNIDIGIKGSTSTPGGWVLAGTAGVDQYVHEYSFDSGSNWAALTTDYQLVASGVPPAAGGTADFRIQVPTSTSDYTTQNVDVTILAVQSS